MVSDLIGLFYYSILKNTHHKDYSINLSYFESCILTPQEYGKMKDFLKVMNTV